VEPRAQLRLLPLSTATTRPTVPVEIGRGEEDAGFGSDAELGGVADLAVEESAGVELVGGGGEGGGCGGSGAVDGAEDFGVADFDEGGSGGGG